MSTVIETGLAALSEAEANLYGNVIDPFSAVIDAMCQQVTLGEWLKQEKARQSQKTLQNAIGDFHQKVIGSIPGWEDLGTGGVVDLKNNSRKILAEVKNKYNTTKGNHKVKIYDDFLSMLSGSNYSSHTCYYVEVIPKNKNIYDETFTPSDNVTHSRRPVNPRIRIIDGKSFYALATGNANALEMLFDAMLKISGDILKLNKSKAESYREFKDLLKKAYNL